MDWPPARTARQIALKVLHRWQETGEFVAGLLDGAFQQASELKSADRGLASDLVLGVVRRRATLAAILKPRLKRPPEQVEPLLWLLLQVGTYQLLYHSADSQHASVHETVELAKWMRKNRWVGFANGVLRSVQRDLPGDHESAGISDPAADALPLGHRRFLKLARPLLPDPQDDPNGYLCAAGSLPAWLVAEWSTRHSFDELLERAAWFNEPAAIWLRVNPLATTGTDALARLADAGVDGSLEAGEQMIRLAGTAHVPGLPGFSEGHISVQDPSAAHAAQLLAPAPGDRVLDLCAAPGTKSTHLAELMENRGEVVAVDSHPGRLALVPSGAERLGLDIIRAVLVDEEGHNLPEGPFDGVLVDVPCSNTGVLGKRPEARWRLEATEPARLAVLQARLLRQAASRVRPGGRLVYSTCSIEPVENEDLVSAFLDDHDEFSLQAQVLHQPGQPADGGFQALLERRNA